MEGLSIHPVKRIEEVLELALAEPIASFSIETAKN
jgi:ATP-dependent Lon protease